MKIAALFILLASLFLCACDKSASSAKEEPPPEQTAPSEVKKPYAGGFTKAQRISDAQTIIGFFERGYAPRALKDDVLDEKFVVRSREFLKEAGEDVSDAEFYGLIAKYVNGFHDAHVFAIFPSSAVASLPFDARYIGGHVVVVHVDKDVPEVKDIIKVGDEIAAFDGKPVAAVLDEIMQFAGGAGNHESELKNAASILTRRRQSIIPLLPKNDEVVINIRPASSEPERETKLKWRREGHEFAGFNDPGIALAPKAQETTYAGGEDDFLEESRMMLWPMHSYLQRERVEVYPPFFLMGSTFVERSLWPYYTGEIVEGKRKIGFIRIHDYLIDYESEKLAELEEEFSYFEKNTDALIIDQTDNPGGNLCFMLDVASLFFTEPFYEIKQRWRANRSILQGMEKTEINKNKSDEDRKIARQIAEGIRETLQTGKLLTEPYAATCSLNGIKNPYLTKDGERITYTKPVLIMVNEKSASCGDFFPALMQDSGRAVIFGTRTMGAGGIIERLDRPIGYSEIMLTRTISLMMREQPVEYAEGKESIYIEGVGTIPDIEYPITLNDFKENYKSYREAAIQSAISLISPDNEAE